MRCERKRRTCCCIALHCTVAAANVSPIYLPATAYAAGFLFPTSSPLLDRFAWRRISVLAFSWGYPFKMQIPLGIPDVTKYSDFAQFKFGRTSPLAASDSSFPNSIVSSNATHFFISDTSAVHHVASRVNASRCLLRSFALSLVLSALIHDRGEVTHSRRAARALVASNRECPTVLGWKGCSGTSHSNDACAKCIYERVHARGWDTGSATRHAPSTLHEITVKRLLRMHLANVSWLEFQSDGFFWSP